MSTENETPSFDDLPESEVSTDDDGSNWIDLEAGDEVTGRITGFNPDAGRNGVVEIDGRPMYITAGIRQGLIAERIWCGNSGKAGAGPAPGYRRSSSPF